MPSLLIVPVMELDKEAVRILENAMASSDLFENFDTQHFIHEDGELFYRMGGNGPPLLLLHGAPQNHCAWAQIAPQLSKDFTLIIPDLPGYGQSTLTHPSPEKSSKRTMSRHLISLMDQLGHSKFSLAGHDRGGRVGYRLAFDFPDRLTALAVLDILPTWEQWARLDRGVAQKFYHWTFWSQPAPMPEEMILALGSRYIDYLFRHWNAQESPASAQAFASYREMLGNESCVTGLCNDYRAGADIDVTHDAQDRAEGHKINCPLLCLTGSRGFLSSYGDATAIWREWAHHVQGKTLECGHFLPEEAPEATAQALGDFFST